MKDKCNTFFLFGCNVGQMGTSEAYILAINEDQEVYNASISGEDASEIASNVKDSVRVVKILGRQDYHLSNEKNGWEVSDYPIQRLLSSKDELIKFESKNFKKGQLVDAGMGNWGTVLLVDEKIEKRKNSWGLFGFLVTLFAHK